METYLFVAADSFDKSNFQGLVAFADAFPEFFDVSLEDENQFNTLLRLIGLSIPQKLILEDNEDFQCLYDISNQTMKEFSEEAFDEFYQQWLAETRRENSMDEYGQLIFILGQAITCNKMAHKFIFSERA